MSGLKLLATVHCDFCGKVAEFVEALIASPGGQHICNECVERCVEILTESREAKAAKLKEPTT